MSIFSDTLAEMSILQAIQINPLSRREIFSCLTANDFTSGHYRDLYSAAREAYLDNELNKQFLQGLSMDFRGGLPMRFADAIDSLKRISYSRQYGSLVKQAEQILANPLKPNSELHEITRKLSALSDETGEVKHRTNQEIGQELLDRQKLGARSCISWGIDRLDIARLEQGVLAVVGARPGVGKTAFCCSLISKMQQAGIRPGMMCFEMDDVQIATRRISQESNNSYLDIARNDFKSDEHKTEFHRALLQFSEDGTRSHCGERLSIQGIEEIATQWVRNEGIQVIFIDYLQRIKHQRADSERLRVGQSCYDLKLLARRLKIPIVLCSQLNRDANGRRPYLSDLKETGDIEQDADIIFLIDRQLNKDDEIKSKYRKVDDFGIETEMNPEHEAAFILAKNRNGKTGMTFLNFDGETMKFH